MASIRTTDFANLLNDDIQKLFSEVAKTSVGQMVGKEIFDMGDTDFKIFNYISTHGMNNIKKTAEGADFESSTNVQGDTASWTQAKYGQLIPVSYEARRFQREQLPCVMDNVRSVSDAAFHMIDQSLADVLTNGFSTSNYTDVYGDSVAATPPDGLALFSAVHTSPVSSRTHRNLIRDLTTSTTNPILSREAIVSARSDAMNYIDPAGVNRPINLDTLIVSPAKEDEALRIINSDGISGSADRDTNPLRTKVKVLPWSKLTTRTGGTDTSAYWFMADSAKVKQSLMAKFADRPAIDPPEQTYKNLTWNWRLFFLYTIGRGWPVYIWGSNAALS